MTDTADDKLEAMTRKLDQIIRVLERLEDRVSAIETGMLDEMAKRRRGTAA
ncbi:MAG: hypothetical protein ACFB22_08525 [Rhodothalassiaceae bacterium]